MHAKALKWVEKQIRKTRQSIGFAESKPNTPHQEIADLYEKLDILEYLSQKVLGMGEV